MFSIGQFVAVLDEDLQGKVVGVTPSKVSIETQDGFLMQYPLNAVVLIPTPKHLKKDIHYKQTKEEKSYVHNEHKTLLKTTAISNTYKNTTNLSTSVNGVPEIDLHIQELVKSIKGMTNSDILEIQLDCAIDFLKQTYRKRIPRVVLIHGKGQGVLKQALYDALERYDNLAISQANPSQYGQGAMEVYFLQHVRHSKVNRFAPPFLFPDVL